MIKKTTFMTLLILVFANIPGLGAIDNPAKKELAQQDNTSNKRQLKVEISTNFICITDLNLQWNNNDQQNSEQDKIDIPGEIKTPSAVAGWTTIMSEDFGGSFPGTKWALGYNGNSSQEGYGYTWDEDDYKSHSGSYSVWCADENYKGKPDLDPQSDNYPNNLTALMTYGPFDLRDATDAELLFYYWNQSEKNYDILSWMASTDGNHFYGQGASGTSNDWLYTNFDLTNVYTLGNLCGKSQVWIAFYFQSDGGNTYKGAFVDDIILRKYVGTAEQITVTSPNGGENWTVGSSHNIAWTSSGTSGNVKIEYSTNSGSSWSTITSSTTDDGSHSWTIPNTPSTTCLVKISDTDGSPSDQSNAVFTISSPYITVTSPNGGENWAVASSHNITWTSSGNSGNVKIEYSTNSGSSWSTIVSSTPDDGTQAWTIPNTPSTTCLVKITDTDGSPSDQSNAVFTISSPYITVTSPNGGEKWVVGSNHNITWTSSGNSGNVKIEYSTNNGSTWSTIISSTPDDGTQAWIIPNTPSTTCLVKITDTDGSPSDQSNNLFSIITETKWKVPITISGGGTSFTRTFGGDPIATDGYDTDLDKAIAPPGMTYYTYFELSDFPNYLETDIRPWISPFQTEITWALKIDNATGMTSTLTWNTADVPTIGMFTLIGAGSDVNMRNQNSTTVTGSANLTIKYSYLNFITYNFAQRGWYLISLPVTPGNNNLNTLFPTAIKAFSYDSATRNYIQVSSLETKKSYWLLIPAATTATVSGVPVSTYTQHYTNGWHLIGSVKGTTGFTDPKDNPDGSVIHAYSYNSATGQYVAVYPPGSGVLEEKKGYWLAVIQTCDLTIGGTGVVNKIDIASSGNRDSFYRQFGSQPPAPPFVANNSDAQFMPISNKIISRNYPNPFNPETLIEYSLPKDGFTQVYIYNAIGQRIRTLVEDRQQAGLHQVLWDGRNNNGELAANGVYFYWIINSGFVESRKILFLK